MVDGQSMAELLEQEEQSFKVPRKGEILKGKVVQVTDDEIVVNIGYKSDGIIKKSEISNNPDINPKEVVQEDQEIEVYVIKKDDGDGNVVLSLKRISMFKDWDVLAELHDKKERIKVKTKDVVKGGIIAYYNDIRGFIPASQLSLNYVNNLEKFAGQEYEVEIIELNKGKRKAVFSRRAILEVENAKLKEALWAKLEVKQKITGEVKRLTNFGAFVDVGGADGLIHISELSWGRVSHPSEVVKVGDQVEVLVLSANKDDGKISLSLKQAKENPWTLVEQNYKVGDVVDGKVVNMTDFGAFVEIEPGVEGLVHISQISKERIEKPADVLEEGKSYPVKIIEMNLEEKRVKLSIKDALESDTVEEDTVIEEVATETEE
jgi:ribosomal protein S1